MDARLQFVADLCREFWDLAQDGLQNLRSLPGVWDSGAD